MFLVIIGAVLLGIWLVLVLFGKGGFAHMIFLGGAATAIVGLVAIYRQRMKEKL